MSRLRTVLDWGGPVLLMLVPSLSLLAALEWALWMRFRFRLMGGSDLIRTILTLGSAVALAEIMRVLRAKYGWTAAVAFFMVVCGAAYLTYAWVIGPRLNQLA